MRLKESDFDKIIADRLVFGKRIEDVAKELDCGTTTVSNVVQMFKLVKEQDFEHIGKLVRKNGSISQAKWAAKKLGVELPESVFEQHELKKADKQEPPKESTPVIAENNDALYFIKILEALHKQNELLEQLCDVVLPHWFGDLKDNLNANTDIINNKQVEQIKICECIKQNTRKRGL